MPSVLEYLPFVGPLISGATSAFNASEQARANRESAEISRYNTDQTIKYQREAADLAWQRELEQWNRANAYGSPKEQMTRLKAAGLNPMLVYGSGSPAGGAAPSPRMSVPNYQSQYQARQATQIDPSLGASAGMLGSNIAELQMKKAQTNNLEASTRNTNMKTALDTMEVFFKAINLFNLPRKAAAETRTSEATATSAEAQARSAASKIFLETQMLAWQSIEKAREDMQSKSLFPYQFEMQKQSVDEQKRRIQNLIASTGGIRATTEKTKAEKDNTVEMKNKIIQDVTNEKLRTKLLNTEWLQRTWDLFLSANQGKYAGVSNPLELFTRWGTISTNFSGEKIWKDFLKFAESQSNK